MGTRSNVQFIQGGEKFQVYVHWDGYPSYKIPFLQRFLKWNGIRNDDLSYTVANFILFGKLDGTKDIGKTFKEAESNMGQLHTGYGMVMVQEPDDPDFSSLHIEWFYRVDLDKKTIEILQPRYKNFDIEKTPTYEVVKPKKIGIVSFDYKLTDATLEQLDQGKTLRGIEAK